MTTRYIGSKARVAEAILSRVGCPSSSDGFFVDAFCGTGIVARHAAELGWSIRLNDHLSCATTIATAALLAPSDVPFERLGGYAQAIQLLNAAPPRQGFIWSQYSPASKQHAGLERMYFTEDNAERIDGMRERIGVWAELERISSMEERLLLGDLLIAVGKVANIAGTYGCFLSHWSSTALKPIELSPRILRQEPVAIEIYTRDVFDVPIDETDVVYFDPPYTKRQYAAYYHILETICQGDEPEVSGITGLRPWRDRASDFCYRARARRALSELIANTPSRRTLLSYSSEGHVRLEDLVDSLPSHSAVTVHELAAIGRYRPNQSASNAGSQVAEYLIEVIRSIEPEYQGSLT